MQMIYVVTFPFSIQIHLPNFTNQCLSTWLNMQIRILLFNIRRFSVWNIRMTLVLPFQLWKAHLCEVMLFLFQVVLKEKEAMEWKRKYEESRREVEEMRCVISQNKDSCALVSGDEWSLRHFPSSPASDVVAGEVGERMKDNVVLFSTIWKTHVTVLSLN